MRPCHYGAMWSYCKALALVRFSSSTFGSCAPWVADSLEFGAFTGNRENTSKGWPPELETFLPVTKYTVHWSHLDPSTDHHIRRLRAFKHKQVDSGLLSLLIERKNQVYQVGACKIISDMVKRPSYFESLKDLSLGTCSRRNCTVGGRRARLGAVCRPMLEKQASLFTKKWSSQAGVCKQGHYSKRTGRNKLMVACWCALLMPYARVPEPNGSKRNRQSRASNTCEGTPSIHLGAGCVPNPAIMAQPCVILCGGWDELVSVRTYPMGCGRFNLYYIYIYTYIMYPVTMQYQLHPASYLDFMLSECWLPAVWQTSPRRRFHQIPGWRFETDAGCW